MIFLTVGTQFPFDRLVKTVDSLYSQNGFGSEFFGQIGQDSYKPVNFRSVPSLEKKDFDRYFTEANAVIGHAGIGTITMALETGKPLLVMPRLKRYHEAVNDHQLAIAERFEQAGHLLVAYTEQQLPAKLAQLKSFVPTPRENQANKVAERIAHFLEQVAILKQTNY
ncbi:MAG: glycosyltransferase [Planctomycetota bacterium]|jgi:UDP-N-acetylglucosamine transferase subunit ALG13